MASSLAHPSRPRPWKRLRRWLPRAVVAAAFAAGLAAAAPHSVHHLGEEAERQRTDCPGVLAWAAATGADCPAPAITLDAPAEIDRISLPGPTVPPAVSVATPFGRAPPPLSRIAS